jgi:cadmium resistance protein CadD (predicted permease)
LDALPVFVATVTAAYVSTNVDGYALLLAFFSNARYRTVEIVAGQFVSMAVQLMLSIAITQSAWVAKAPCIGLAGVVPLTVGLTRIAGLRQGDGCDEQSAGRCTIPAAGCAGRIFTVAAVATSGAVDNVLMYSGLLIGRPPADISLAMVIFGVLTAMLCLGAFVTTRSHVSIAGLQKAAARLAPFATTAIGLSLLIRFDTLAWIYSLA